MVAQFILNNIKDFLLVIKGHILYLRETVLSERDKMLFSRSTCVHSDRQQAFQSSNNKTRLFWIFVCLLFHFFPFLVWNDSLRWENTRNWKTQAKKYSLNSIYPSIHPSFLYFFTFDILHLLSMIRKDMLLISFWTTKFCSSLLKFCRQQYKTEPASDRKWFLHKLTVEILTNLKDEDGDVPNFIWVLKSLKTVFICTFGWEMMKCGQTSKSGNWRRLQPVAVQYM